MDNRKQLTNIDTLKKPIYDEVLSEEAKSLLEDADDNFGYTKERLEFRNEVAHELRVFAVLSLMTVESEVCGHGLKNGFSSNEVMNRHAASDCRSVYKTALESLTEVGLVVKDQKSNQTDYYIHPDIELGPVFDIDTEEELENLVVANKEDAKKPQYIGTLLPGMGGMVEAAGNKQLAESPVAIGKGTLSVGVALSLVGVLQFATPGVVPSMDFLEGIWLLFSFGIAATIGGLLQRGDVWIQTHRTTSLQ
jgi:hypothetical protein